MLMLRSFLNHQNLLWPISHLGFCGQSTLSLAEHPIACLYCRYLVDRIYTSTSNNEASEIGKKSKLVVGFDPVNLFNLNTLFPDLNDGLQK